MPILPPEPDLYPNDVLTGDAGQSPWWAIYTMARQEKSLMRKLREMDVGHYGPLIEKRNRSPAGRVRSSYVPLFTNYVFVRGDNDIRYQAVTTGCVSKCIEVTDTAALVTDLCQVRQLIESGVPLSQESRIEPGDLVRVRNGQFAGYEGQVVKRHQATLLIVEVRFMNQGVSVALDDCQLETISKRTQT